MWCQESHLIWRWMDSYTEDEQLSARVFFQHLWKLLATISLGGLWRLDFGDQQVLTEIIIFTCQACLSVLSPLVLLPAKTKDHWSASESPLMVSYTSFRHCCLIRHEWAIRLLFKAISLYLEVELMCHLKSVQQSLLVMSFLLPPEKMYICPKDFLGGHTVEQILRRLVESHNPSRLS